MKISVRFTAAVHTLLCILYFEKDYRVTSEFIAASTGVNAVIIRKILLQLQKAGLVRTVAGAGGSHLQGRRMKSTCLIFITQSIRTKTNGQYSTFIRLPIRNVPSEKIFIAYLIPHWQMRKKQWKTKCKKLRFRICFHNWTAKKTAEIFGQFYIFMPLKKNASIRFALQVRDKVLPSKNGLLLLYRRLHGRVSGLALPLLRENRFLQ